MHILSKYLQFAITLLLYYKPFHLQKTVLTSIQCRNYLVCHWSIPPNVTGRDGAIVGGSWCEPSQCEGACCCVLHRNAAPPTSLGDTGEEVASDHSIAQGGCRRGPRECHVPWSLLSVCETQWWTCGGWCRGRLSICRDGTNAQYMQYLKGKSNAIDTA